MTWRCTSCGSVRVETPGIATLVDGVRRGYCTNERTMQMFLWNETLRSVDAPPVEQFETGIAISESVAQNAWTEFERQLVDEAIEHVARARQTFTADDIWLELGENFIVTKGLAGRLTAARHKKLIEATGTVTFSQRKNEHGHGQRLAVWRSLVW